MTDNPRFAPSGASILGDSHTLPEARSAIASALRHAGIPDAAFEARVLIEDLGGSGPGLDDTGRSRLAEALDRRLRGMPLWRLLGEREFWGLPFSLSPATLEPRPDSETLIEATIAAFAARREASLRMLDLGTGTGCLLIAALHEFPRASGLGVDLSDEAVATATANAARNGLGERCAFRQGRWTEGLTEQFDLILSNPPYIPVGDIPGLDAAVREHDPMLALDGGADGLDAYRALAATLPAHLRPEGRIILEIGAGQSQDVIALMEAAGLRHAGSRKDLGGHDRAIVFVHSGTVRTGF